MAYSAAPVKYGPHRKRGLSPTQTGPVPNAMRRPCGLLQLDDDGGEAGERGRDDAGLDRDRRAVTSLTTFVESAENFAMSDVVLG